MVLPDRHPHAPESPAAEITSDELLTRVDHGDERACEQLYERLAGPVSGMACRVLLDRSHREEVAQEVTLELWRTATRCSAEKARRRAGSAPLSAAA